MSPPYELNDEPCAATLETLNETRAQPVSIILPQAGALTLNQMTYYEATSKALALGSTCFATLLPSKFKAHQVVISGRGAAKLVVAVLGKPFSGSHKNWYACKTIKPPQSFRRC